MATNKKAFWEDLGEDVRKQLTAHALDTDRKNEEAISELKRQALDPSVTKFYTRDVPKPDASMAFMTRSEKRRLSKAARQYDRELKRHQWTAKNVQRLGGVTERVIFNPYTRKSTVVSKTDRKGNRWTLFDGMNDPADVANVFGIKYRSAFDNLPERRPVLKNTSAPAVQGPADSPAAPATQPATPSAPATQPVIPATPATPPAAPIKAPATPSVPSAIAPVPGAQQPAKTTPASPVKKELPPGTAPIFGKDRKARRLVLKEYAGSSGLSREDWADVSFLTRSHASVGGVTDFTAAARSEVEARIAAKKLGIVYTGGDVSDVYQAFKTRNDELKKRGLV